MNILKCVSCDYPCICNYHVELTVTSSVRILRLTELHSWQINETIKTLLYATKIANTNYRSYFMRRPTLKAPHKSRISSLFIHRP